MIWIDFVEIMVFPGLFLTFYLAIVFSWLFRKLMAKMENRVGPPFNQPLFDFAKFMAKERVYPKGSHVFLIRLLPRVQVAIALFMTLFIPILGNEGLITFEGDVYVFIFLLALHGSIAFFIGWASNNPYSVNGAGRAVLTEISLEIPMALVLAGLSIMTDSLRIADITQRVPSMLLQGDVINRLYFIPVIILFVVMVYSVLGALEMNPFSAAHAETEIVAGWTTELTGSDMAMTKLAEMLNLFNLGGIMAAVFLGGPILLEFNTETFWTQLLVTLVALLTFLLKAVLVTFILAFVATTSSRLRIDQITRVLWIYFLPTAMLGIFLILGIKAMG